MNLLPCPFCGNTNVIVFDWTVSDNTFDGHKEYAYTCQNCGSVSVQRKRWKKLGEVATSALMLFKVGE